jgi:hypothetical protein
MHHRFRVLAVVSALVVSLVAGSTAFGQDKKGAPPKVDKAYQAEIDAATKIVDDALKGQAAPSDFKFSFTGHPMKGQGAKTFIPFLISFEKGQTLPASAVYYLRIVSKENLEKAQKVIAEHDAAVQKAAMAAKLEPENTELADAEEKIRAEAPKIEYAFEDLKNVSFNKPKPDSDFRLPAAMMVAPGTYDAYILIKEPAASVKGKKVPAKVGLLKVALTVPNYATDELATSTLIVTNTVAVLKSPPSAAELAMNPYIFGSTAVTPSFTDRFAKADDLTVFFFIYNTGTDKATGKPDVSVDYNFYTKTGTAEKFFNKTDQLQWNAKTLPPNFDAKAGFMLPGTQTIPLGSFPEGDYRLEIKITDKVSGKTKIESVRFTVTP